MTDTPSIFAQAAMALGMLASFALVIGAILLFRRGVPRRRPVLMLILAVVLIANVLIVSL